MNHDWALGSPWTRDDMDTSPPGHGNTLIRAWPLGLESSPVGLEGGEGRTMIPFHGPPV
jgi:hypothetical protein